MRFSFKFWFKKRLSDEQEEEEEIKKARIEQIKKSKINSKVEQIKGRIDKINIQNKRIIQEMADLSDEEIDEISLYLSNTSLPTIRDTLEKKE